MKTSPKLAKTYSVEDIARFIVDVPNFPKPGIIFKDVTPIFAHGEAFQSLIRHMAETIHQETSAIVAIESRGFIFGSALAHELGIGFVLARKPGKLPRKVISHTYQLEYGSDTLEMHSDDLSPQDRVIIVDDVLATGGTANAVETLCQNIGAQVVGHRFLLEIEFLKGRSRLGSEVQSLILV